MQESPELPEEQMSVADVAARFGIAESTVRGYNSAGRMPAPDGHVGAAPWWWSSTIDRYAKDRAAGPGQNWRKGLTNAERKAKL